MAMRIGCDHLVYAIMKTEGDRKTAPTWNAPKEAKGVMSLNINPNASQETAFYDDGPGETATTLGAIEVELQKSELTTENKADLLGHSIDAKGGLVYGAQDTPPWVAIGFRTLKSNGTYRYVWLYQGKFIEPEDNNETKGDSINFQADTITGQFVKIAHEYPVKTSEEKTVFTQPWKYEIDAEFEKADAGIIKKWFDAVLLPDKGTDSLSSH